MNSDESKLELLDGMLTRLALCDDSRLSELLSKLLPLSISFLSSQSLAVRNKVIGILSHINKRVKHRIDIGLPTLELLRLYSEENVAPMVKNFSIIYIEMAFERMDKKEKENMAPKLLANLSKVTSQQQEIVLRIVFKVIGDCHSSHIDSDTAEKYKFICGSPDLEFFFEFGFHTILCTLNSQSLECPAGLSVVQRERVIGKDLLTDDVLLARKLGILNVVDAMDLEPEVMYPLYLASCVDCQEPVAKKGEALLKKASAVNFEDTKLINKLFVMFNGSIENKGPKFNVNPGSYALRIRLMSIFCRSIEAANSFRNTLQCIFSCIYGKANTPRLKQCAMEFTVWTFKHARDEQLNLMGPLLFAGILNTLGTSSNLWTDSSSHETKVFVFQSIGLLAQRMPQLFSGRDDIITRLFEAVKTEPQFLRSIIQEAICSLLGAYKNAPAAVMKKLEKLLFDNCEVEQCEARFGAVRWATSLFDMSHCPSRFICMICAADSKLDIREMALEGLFKEVNREQSVISVNLPKLEDMIDFVFGKQPLLSISVEFEEHKLLFPEKMYMAMVKFLMMCFKEDAENSVRKEHFRNSVEKLCVLLEHAMSFEGSFELHACSLKSLIDIASHFAEFIASRYALKVVWLKKFLGHMDVDTRESAARLLGIADSVFPLSSSCSFISELVFSISESGKQRFEATHGAICTLGFVVADCRSRKPDLPEPLLESALKALVDVANSGTTLLASFSLQALGHIGLSSPLPSLNNDSGPGEIFTLLHERMSKILSGDDIKAVQRTVISLGHICLKEKSSSRINSALEYIFGLSRLKAEEILFAGGEAISFIWGGVPIAAHVLLKTNYDSSLMMSRLVKGDVTLISPQSLSDTEFGIVESSRVEIRESITRKLFDVFLCSSNKEERCAGTVWLLSLLVYCGRHSSIQPLLPEIQEAFSHLIGDQNELTQELASQGLSVVYEIGDASMKEQLVNSLVGTLTGSGKRKRTVKISGDSEVFQEGTIGGSPSGGKLTTYKELCSLASEMGQPDLIYKFMDLANYQASLNSKRGAAFGFSHIAKKAGEALKPHLRLMIPRLVRYQYDPDKSVQDAMILIWKSLVSDSRRTIDENMEIIVNDLLEQCGSRLWRSRESSCLALADIIQGRKFDQIAKHLKGIWIAAFRAMDDIKETVRNSGDKLCRSVTSLTLRLCDVSLTEALDSGQAINIVLPLLLKEGMMSKVDNIQKASISVVAKISKGSGIAIRPQLPDLVCCMLESLSSLEDQGLNYVELHAAKVGIQTEKLENLRISIAKSSPMWETLDHCISVADKESLDLLLPRLSQLVRSGIGLNTRVGVASFISLLVQKVGIDIKPFTSMLLKVLFHSAKEEKSNASKRAFASACALVLKFTAPLAAQKLIEDTAAMHCGDKNAMISCAILLKAFSSTAADVFSGYHTVIIPVVFISRFEEDKYVSSLFEELWEDNTSGDSITLQLHIDDITSIVSNGISSSSWSSKKKSAKAISKLCEVLGESIGSYSNVVLKLLIKEVPGHLWEGKECILNALATVCASSPNSILKENPASPTEILEVVSSACMKKVKLYSDASLSCLEQVIKAFCHPKFFNSIFPMLFEMSNSGAPMDDVRKVSSVEDSAEKTSLNKILDCITFSVRCASTEDVMEQRKDLVHLLLASLSSGFPWTVKMAAFSLVKELCSKLGGEKQEKLPCTLFAHELGESLLPAAVECIRTVKISQVHVASSESILELIKLQKKREQSCVSRDELLSLCGGVVKDETAISLLKNSIDAIHTFNNT